MAKRRAEENNQQKQPPPPRPTPQQQQQQQHHHQSTKRPRDDNNNSSSTTTTNANKSYSQQQQQQPPRSKKPALLNDVDSLLDLADTTNVAIIVPFRDMHIEQHRAAHLAQFVPHMVQFLTQLQRKEQKISDFHIYIVEQSDDGRKFNRGKLLNIGFDLARRNKRTRHDVYIFHDVDLLPQNDLGDDYAKFPKVPYHIARVWDRYSNNPKYFGGVVSFSSSDFKRINGYPNTFWGWYVG
jgi:hypothetical protein